MRYRTSLFVALILSFSVVASGQSLSKFRSKPAKGDATSDGRNAQESGHPKVLLGDFHPVTGTKFLRANLGADNKKISGSLSKAGITESLRNLVFFDTETDTATTLLPENHSVILSIDTLPERLIPRNSHPISVNEVELISATGLTQSNNTTLSVRWHVIELVTADTDGDGVLTVEDRHSLGIADAGGRGFAEVISQLGHVFSRTMIDENTLLIIHGSQAKQVAVRVDLQTRKVITSKILPNFGTQ